MEERLKDLKLGEKGAMLSIAVYLFLSGVKLFVGQWANSHAMQADGLNNMTDIIASAAVLIGLRISQRPADKDHRYGHWKAEAVASMVAAFIMVAVGIQVLLNAADSVMNGKTVTPDMLSLWVGLASAVIMYGVYRYNLKLARRIRSQAVLAAAKDNLSDAWVSIGTVVGIAGSQFHLPWLDPITAVIVGLLICKTGWTIFREASHDLTDGYDEERLETYKETISEVPGVERIKDIRARKYGSNSVVDAVIFVDPSLNISAAHAISSRVEERLIEDFDVFEVHVHVEPEGEKKDCK